MQEHKPNPHRNIKGTFGDDDTDTWKPYTYAQHLSLADRVAAFQAADAKSGLTQNPTHVPNRLTSFTSDTLECRQVEKPLIGKYTDLSKLEPLHCKNNTVKELFVKLLKHACNITNIGNTKKFNNRARNQSLPMFVSYVHSVCTQLMHWNLLAK